MTNDPERNRAAAAEPSPLRITKLEADRTAIHESAFKDKKNLPKVTLSWKVESPTPDFEVQFYLSPAIKGTSSLAEGSGVFSVDRAQTIVMTATAGGSTVAAAAVILGFEWAKTRDLELGERFSDTAPTQSIVIAGQRAFVPNQSGYVSVIDTGTLEIVVKKIVVGGTPSAVAVAGQQAFVPNYSGYVSVIDTEALKVVQEQIQVGGAALSVAIAGQRAFVANAANYVSVIDTETLEVIQQQIPVGGQPQVVAMTDRWAYVLSNSGEVTVIDTDTLAVVEGMRRKVAQDPWTIAFASQWAFVPDWTSTVKAFPVEKPQPRRFPPPMVEITVGGSANAIAIAGKRAFVTSYSAAWVSVIDTETRQIVNGDISVGGAPWAIAVAGQWAFAANESINNNEANVAVIDTETLEVMQKRIVVGKEVDSLAVTGKRAFLGCSSGDVAVVDPVELQVTKEITENVVSLPNALATFPFFLPPDPTPRQQAAAGKAFIAGSGSVSVLDLRTNTLGQSISTGVDAASHGIAVSPQGYVFVTGTAGLAVIDPLLRTGHSITVPAGPSAIAFLPDGTRAYVSHTTGQVTVIDTSAADPTGYQVLQELPMGTTLQDVVVSTDGSAAYAADHSAAQQILRFDPTTGQSLGSPLVLPEHPFGLALARDGKKLYVTSRPLPSPAPQTDTCVYKIDTEAWAIEEQLPVGALLLGRALLPGDGRLLVNSQKVQALFVIDTLDMSIVGTLPIPQGTELTAVACSAEGSRVVVTNYQNPASVTVLEPAVPLYVPGWLHLAAWVRIAPAGQVGGFAAGLYRHPLEPTAPLCLLVDVDGQGVPETLSDLETSMRPVGFLWLANPDQLDDGKLAQAVFATAALAPKALGNSQYQLPYLVWGTAEAGGLQGIQRIDVAWLPGAVESLTVQAVDFPLAGRLSLILQYPCTLTRDANGFHFTSTGPTGFSGIGLQVEAAASALKSPRAPWHRRLLASLSGLVGLGAAGDTADPLQLAFTPTLTIPSSGTESGRLLGGLWIDQGPLLFELGAELRVAGWGGSAWQVTTYPFHVEPEETDVFVFQASLDPLALFDPARTRFDFDPAWENKPNPRGEGRTNLFQLQTFRRTSGDAVTLQPVYAETPAPGFALGLSPLVVRGNGSVTVQDTPDVYLTPNGTFQVDAGEAVELMGGTSGTEYFFVPEDGLLVFQPGNEAEAAVLAGGTPHDPATRWTTAWTEVRSNGTVRWCTQALSATQYVTQTLPTLPPGILVATSPELQHGPDLGPVPLMPYGGVYEELVRDGWTSTNADLENRVAVIDASEAAVSAKRRSLLSAGAIPVVLMPDHSGPKSGNRSRTPQGLVAEINSAPEVHGAFRRTGPMPGPLGATGPGAGTWKSIQLATYTHKLVSPQNLAIEADPTTGRVNDDLALALTGTDGVIAVGDVKKYFFPATGQGDFKISDFDYETSSAPLAIIKLDHAHSFQELVQPGAWKPKVLGGTAEGALTTLNDLLETANQAAATFKDFLDNVWNNAGWTGVLFVDPSINQQELPLSIQMLLGGMNLNDGLRAQVFGITLNQVDNDELDGTAPMKASSVFAVIHYEDSSYKPPSDTLQFAVTKFAAVTINSQLATLAATVDMTVPSLWSIPVTLDPPRADGTPTFTISGHRIDHPDGTASLTFATSSSSTFRPQAGLQGANVLDSFAVSGAALVPIGKDPQNPENVLSAFDIGGLLRFDKAPLGQVAGLANLDLFGYGDDFPLHVPKYRITMDTDVPANGQAVIESYAEDLTSIPVTPEPQNQQNDGATARSGSVPASLHLAVSSIDHNAQGYQGDGDELWSLGITTNAQGGGSPLYGPYPPCFALKLKVPIGPAGALSSSHARKSGWLYLGWTVSTVDNATTINAGATLDLNGVTLMLDDVIKSSWEDVALMLVASAPPTPALCFTHFQSSVFGLDLLDLTKAFDPDLFLFGGQDTKNLLWYRGPAPTNASLGVQMPYYAVARGALPAVSVTQPNPITAALAWSRTNFGGKPSVVDFINTNMTKATASDTGLFVGIEADLLLAQVGIVLDDAGLWGGRLAIPSKLPPWMKVAAVSTGLASALAKLAGFQIEIAYRKIHDGLGMVTVFFVPPGSPFKFDDATLWAPSIGWSQWTNGDHQLAVGWPMDANPLKIQVQLGDFPLEGRVGLILGELHGDDGIMGSWKYAKEYSVSELGLGLAVGFGKSGSKDGLSWNASAVLQVTNQGFLASWTGNPDQVPIARGQKLATYQWGTVTAGLLVHGDFSLGLGIVSISGSLNASLLSMFVLETLHTTSISLSMSFAVDLRLKLTFITVHVHFSTTLHLGSWTAGEGPLASAAGPTPQALSLSAAPHSGPALESGPGLVVGPAPAVSQEEKLPVPCIFTVEPFAQVPGTGTPAAAGLALLGTDENSFGQLAQRYGQWLLARFWEGGKPTVAVLLDAVRDALTSHPLTTDALIAEWITPNLEFTYAAAGGGQTLTLLPMVPTLGIEIGGLAYTFVLASEPLPCNYPDIVRAYYAKQPLPAPAGTGQSMSGYLFEDGWNHLAHWLLGELEGLAGSLQPKDTAAETWTAIQASLTGSAWQDAQQNLRGKTSKQALSGSRVPNPPDWSTLVPVHQLSGQLIDLSEYRTVKLFRLDLTPPHAPRVEDLATVTLTEAQLTFTLNPVAWTLQRTPALTTVDQTWQLTGPLAWAADNFGDPQVFVLGRGLARAAWSRNARLACFTVKQPEDGQQLDVHTATQTPWASTELLSLPIRVRKTKAPQGTNIFEVESLGEAPRTLLEDLLEKVTAGTIVIHGLALTEKTGTKLATVGGTPGKPLTLLRANLSSSSRGPDAGAPPHVLGPNVAVAQNGSPAADLASFLTLLWETSVSQTGGFYLAGDGLPQDADTKTLTLIVKADVKSGAFLANTLAGKTLPDASLLFATLEVAGLPLQHAGPAFPAGAAGWNAQLETADLDIKSNLADMYHTPVWRWQGKPESDREGRWSRPVHARTDDAGTTVSYLSTFTTPTAGNRYENVWTQVAVELGLVDPVGHLVTGPALARVASGLAFDAANELYVLYNDAVEPLGHWPGCSPSYTIETIGGKPALKIDPGFAAADLFPKVGDASFAAAAQRTVDLWCRIWDQIHDANLSAGIATTLGSFDDAAISTDLQTWLTACIELGGKEIGNEGIQEITVSGPVAEALKKGAQGQAGTLVPLTRALDPKFPASWAASLEELTVTITFERGLPADATVLGLQQAVYTADASVQSASSFVIPHHSKVDEAHSLRAFATDLEATYKDWNGDGTMLKLSVGTVSDPTSERFGQTAVWLMRWGQPGGVTIAADPATASYFSPPPLDTRLWRGKTSVDQIGPGFVVTPHDVTFTAVDTDAWAARFLETFESFFQPSFALALAGESQYDAVAGVKADLAESIAETVRSVYSDGPQGDSSRAQAVMHQALLQDLRADYGTSTIAQVQATVTLGGPVEENAKLPPQVFGPVHGSYASSTYSLTPAKLPLDENDTKPWLTSLVHAVHPGAQSVLSVDARFDVQFLEHLRHIADVGTDGSGYGYVPSSWLSFLLPDDPVLKTSLGKLQIPVPLRRFPSPPKLLGQTARPTKTVFNEISDALAWSYSVTLEKPAAAQDTFHLRIVFNEDPSDKTFSGGTGHDASAAQDPLFEALAAFHTTWPQLKPYLPGGGQPGHEEDALAELETLIGNVSGSWKNWKAGSPAPKPPAPAHHTYWEYEIKWATAGGRPTVKVQGGSPAPEVGGTSAAPVLSWDDLYIVDLQSARAYAWVTRNADLGLKVDPAFVYATDPIRLPAPVVPLIEVPAIPGIHVDGASLTGALTALLTAMATPDSSWQTGDPAERQISYSTTISYDYGLVVDPQVAGSEIRTRHPLFLVTRESPMQQPTHSVPDVVQTLTGWHGQAKPAGETPELRWAWTLFSTKLTSENHADHHVPLVRFHDLAIKVGGDATWWE